MLVGLHAHELRPEDWPTLDIKVDPRAHSPLVFKLYLCVGMTAEVFPLKLKIRLVNQLIHVAINHTNRGSQGFVTSNQFSENLAKQFHPKWSVDSDGDRDFPRS